MDETLWSLCREYLKWSANGVPIICVSQKPIDFGLNVCVGDIGRSMESIWMQMLAGAKVATTKYVAMAEQDNIYPLGYFDYRPSSNDTFYYNFNYVLLHHGEDRDVFAVNNEIRCASSQLVCNRELFIDAITWVLSELDNGQRIKNCNGLIIEPGAWRNLFYSNVDQKFTKYDFYWGKWPSIDIRLSNGFTKQKREYKMLSDKSIYWGSIDDVFNKTVMASPCMELVL